MELIDQNGSSAELEHRELTPQGESSCTLRCMLDLVRSYELVKLLTFAVDEVDSKEDEVVCHSDSLDAWHQSSLSHRSLWVE